MNGFVVIPEGTKMAVFTASAVMAEYDPFGFLTAPACGPIDGFDAAEMVETAAVLRDRIELALNDNEALTCDRHTAGCFIAILGLAVGTYDDDDMDPETAAYVASWQAAANVVIAASAAA